MSEKNPLFSSEEESPGQVSGQSRPSAMSSGALARRKLLIKSLGKGSAVLAAASVPIQTLATTTLVRNGQICSVSGMQSGVHSRPPTSNTCNGYSPGKYKDRANWPANCNADALVTAVCSRSTLKVYKYRKVVTRPDKTSVTSFFRSYKSNAASTSTSADGTKTVITYDSMVVATLFEAVDGFPNSDECHWICAWLNALGGPTGSGILFPYSTTEVIAFYNLGSGSTEYINALSFFKSYMENL